MHSADNRDKLDLSNVNNLLGRHNFQNIAFAFATCRALGVGASEIAHYVRTFQPLPHRMNVVRKIDDILIVNDSKATNPNSASKALATFVGYKIFWLIGGRSKNIDPLPYVSGYLQSVAKIYAFGEAAREFEAIFNSLKPCEVFENMVQALHKSFQEARQSDGARVILLSPMCASFDQFNSFEQRGNRFVKAVTEL